MVCIGIGTGFFLSVGTGLGIGLFAGADWWLQGLIGVIIITILHIVTKSQNYKDSVSNCQNMGVVFSMLRYFIFNVFLNTVIVLVVFGLVRLVMHYT